MIIDAWFAAISIADLKRERSPVCKGGRGTKKERIPSPTGRESRSASMVSGQGQPCSVFVEQFLYKGNLVGEEASKRDNHRARQEPDLMVKLVESSEGFGPEQNQHQGHRKPALSETAGGAHRAGARQPGSAPSFNPFAGERVKFARQRDRLSSLAFPKNPTSIFPGKTFESIQRTAALSVLV